MPRRQCAPSPACGGGLGRGCFHVGFSCVEKAPPAALSERVGLPRKRERRSEPADSLVNAICDCPALAGGSGRLLPERLVKRGLETLTTKFT
jgi:hypothetical protein